MVLQIVKHKWWQNEKSLLIGQKWKTKNTRLIFIVLNAQCL